jgi:hypothetical protein
MPRQVQAHHRMQAKFAAPIVDEDPISDLFRICFSWRLWVSFADTKRLMRCLWVCTKIAKPAPLT